MEDRGATPAGKHQYTIHANGVAEADRQASTLRDRHGQAVQMLIVFDPNDAGWARLFVGTDDPEIARELDAL